MNKFIVRYLRYHQRENKSNVSKFIGVKANGQERLLLRDLQNTSFYSTAFFLWCILHISNTSLC